MKKISFIFIVLINLVACNRNEVIILDELPKNEEVQEERVIVYEYTPAPGQFINENYSAKTPAEAVAFAQGRLDKKQFLSLGAFGGYVVLGFEKGLKNKAGADFAVIGNAFDGNSEPAVVYVMYDANHNQKPDEIWYELCGSESGKPETMQNYAVTYFRPEGEKMNVKWTDSEGNSGEIDYNNFHKQPSYYPEWISEDSYTLRGTRLQARNRLEVSIWIMPGYEWGYADNFSHTDYIAEKKANAFEIENAIDETLKKVELDSIHFIKIQTAVNAKSGNVGEMSSEVFGIYAL